MEKVKICKTWTAVVTPFNEDLSIDFASLEKLLILQAEAQNGILILGSTGEALAINLEERKKVVEFVTKLNLNVPIKVGVGGINLSETSQWVEHCNDFAIDSFLMVTPLYAKPGRIGQLEWFTKLLDSAQRPCMLYNIPSRTGIALNLEVVTELASHPHFYAIKDASGSVENFKEYKLRAKNIAVYSGDDALISDLAAEGAAGLVSVAANIWPQLTHQYVEDCLEKRQNEAQITLWKIASAALFTASNPIPTKSLLFHKRLISTRKLRPPLTHQDMIDLDQLIKLDIKIENLEGVVD